MVPSGEDNFIVTMVVACTGHAVWLALDLVGQSSDWTSYGFIPLQVPACAAAAPETTPGGSQSSQSSAIEIDSDGDGVRDADDNCPTTWNANQADDDQDGAGNACDADAGIFIDSDQDGVGDETDNCPTTANQSQSDADGDGLGDACDAETATIDIDQDGVPDGRDNCPSTYNPEQSDSDSDGLGDACDQDVDLRDFDGDGIRDTSDNCPTTPNPDQADNDGDGIGNACDNVEACTTGCIPQVDPGNPSAQFHFWGYATNYFAAVIADTPYALYDRDPGGNTIVTTGWTNSDGAFDMSVPCNQDPTESGNDRAIDALLVFTLGDTTNGNEVHTISMRVAEDESQTYKYQYTGPGNGCGEYAMGHVWTDNLDGRAIYVINGWNMVRADLLLAYEMWPDTTWLELKVWGPTPEVTQGNTPDPASYRPDLDRIEFKEGSDSWTAFTFGHEVGHYVADQVRMNQGYSTDDRDGADGNLGDDGHGDCVEIQTEPFAWNEGLASFWSALNGNPQAATCHDRFGPNHEWNVQAILTDYCDPLCTGETRHWASEGVADPQWKATYAAYLKKAERTIVAYDGHTLRANRHLTVAADRGNWSINDAPTSIAVHTPEENVWQGVNVYVHASWADPDTRVDRAKVTLNFGSGCGIISTIPLSTSASGVYLSPSYGDVRTNVRACITGVDELGAEAPRMMSAPFRLDTQAPSSSPAISYDIANPTNWQVSWTATDGAGSGFQSLDLYEKKPGESWTLIVATTSSTGSVQRGYTLPEATGDFCYATVSTDIVANEQSSSDQAIEARKICIRYPV